MKKIIALVACAVLFAGTAFSQNYKNAVGIRIGGYNAGRTYKHALNQGNAIEAMLWYNWNSGFSVSGLYEWSTQVINPDFNLYYGAGLHIGMYTNAFALGIDGIVGLEYKIPSAPIAFSIDYKPSINFVPGIDAYGFFDFALGIKYTF